MSQAIRDVVIRLAVEQIQSALKAPDIAPVIKVHEEIAKSVEKWGKYEEGAISSINFHRIKMAEVSALRERQLNEERAAEFSKAMAREQADHRQALENERQASEEAEKKESARINKRSEAWVDLAESVVKYAAIKSIAENDGSAEGGKFFETSVKLYGQFKLLRETAEKIPAALGMSDEVAGTLAARMNAVGVAAGIAFVAAKGLQQALYVGSGMAAANAQAEILQLRANTGVAGSDSPFATPAQQKAAGKESDIRLKHNDSWGYWAQQKMIQAGGWIRRMSSEATDAVFGEGASSTGRDSIKELAAKQTSKQNEEIAGRTRGFEERMMRGQLGRSKLADEKALLELEQQRKLVVEEIASIEAKSNLADDEVKEVRLAQLAQAQLSMAKEEQAIRTKQLQTQGEMAAKQQQAYSLSKQQFEEEQKRVASAKEGAGRMNRAQQAQAMNLARRIREGTATDNDYEQAEKIIPASILGDRAKKHFEQKGAGFANDLNAALGNEPLEGRGSALEAKQEDMENQEGLLEMYKERNTELKEAFKDLMATISEMQVEANIARNKLRERAAQN